MKNLHTKKVPCFFCKKELKTFGRSDSLRSHLMTCQSFVKIVRHYYGGDISKEDFKTITWRYSLESGKKNRLPRNFDESDLQQVCQIECVYDAPVTDVELFQLNNLVNQYKLTKSQSNNFNPNIQNTLCDNQKSTYLSIEKSND
eukprot:NODE_8_length_66115_cov_0.981823.p48 type:complete len:144 gc:universal NODE_8_length_66115_cov_0.981823:38685-39116(+)